MIRTFVAVDFPAEIQNSFSEFLRALPALSPGAVKWVEPHNFHLTLRFLGPTPEEKVAATGDALRQAVSGQPSFPMTLQGLGAFPSPHAPQILWIGMPDAQEALAALAQRLQVALEPLGFIPETRPFVAHATLGRVKKARGPHIKVLQDVLRRHAELNFGHCRAKVIVWLQSTLTPQGPVYKVLEKIPLIP